jgi:ATP-dependent exoDNAse (exonuclease V) alpha subunit
LRKEGFDATTLATLLQDSRLDLPGKTMVVLDEAGAVGIDDMRRLLETAKRNRLVLCGDTGQHASVARGDALRIIEEYSPFTFGRLTQLRRQRRADYRRVVELAAKHETAEAFAELERLGCVTELDRDEVQRAAASAYLTAAQGGKSALLVAPTWAEIEAVTEQVRKELKARGQLGNDEQEFRVFDSLSWTEAQKRDARHYQSGQVLRFIRRAGRFARHEMVEITGVKGDVLQVCRKDGSVVSLKPGRRVASSARLDVGEARTLKVAAGDKLLLQANRSRQFVNGELVEVRAVEGEIIGLTDGRTIPVDYRTFTHGYAVTSHAAQGKTADAVFVVASSRSLPAVHCQQFYVSVSRGRDRCQVFTDDKELLRARVTRSSARLAAVEAIAGSRGRVKPLAYDVARRLRTVLSGLRQRIGGMRTPHLQSRAETPATRVHLGI